MPAETAGQLRFADPLVPHSLVENYVDRGQGRQRRATVARRGRRNILASVDPGCDGFLKRVDGDSIDRLGLVTESVVAVKGQPVAEDGDVVVARLADEITLKRYVREDERRIELHPKSTNPDHQPIRIDLEHDPFEVAGVAGGALIGDGFNRPDYEDWPA